MRPSYRNVTRKVKHKFSPANVITQEERGAMLQSIFDSQLGHLLLMHPVDGLEPILALNLWNLYNSLKYDDPISNLHWAPTLDREMTNLLKKCGYME
jgi:hypothetical protein